jgi:hypothetical protein
MFFEDNVLTFTNSTSSGQGCTDGWGGAGYVVRFNTSLQCRFAAHGEKHEGGPANYEFYGNRVMLDGGSSTASAFFRDCTWCFQLQGSGEMTAFHNSFSATLGRSTWVIETQDYRSSPNGDTTNYSPDLGGAMPRCDGTLTTPFGGIVVDGNRTPDTTYRGYPCWHQAGRDRAHVLKPMYFWNNYWADTLGNVFVSAFLNDIGGSPDYLTNHIQANRDFYFAVSVSAQSSPTSPFNGTTGMGFGTLANRPTTCTPTSEALDAGNGGVGYWAYDQGTWKSATPSQGVWTVGQQGILYTCSATNTWSVHYTPYLYPHPLATGGAPDTTPPAAPTGVMVSQAPVLHE